MVVKKIHKGVTKKCKKKPIATAILEDLNNVKATRKTLWEVIVLINQHFKPIADVPPIMI